MHLPSGPRQKKPNTSVRIPGVIRSAPVTGTFYQIRTLSAGGRYIPSPAQTLNGRTTRFKAILAAM
jgi:hypothetical protein